MRRQLDRCRVATVAVLLGVAATLTVACGDDAPDAGGASPTSAPPSTASAASATAVSPSLDEPSAFVIEAGPATFRVDMASGDVTEIMRFPPALAADEFATYYHVYAVSPDGRMLATLCDDAGAIRTAEINANLCLYDGASARSRMLVSRADLVRPGSVARIGTYEAPFAFSPDGRWIVFYARVSDSTTDVYVADVTTGVARRVLEQTVSAPWSEARWSPDSRRFAIRRVHEAPYSLDLTVVDASTGAVTDVAAAVDRRILITGDISWSPDGSTLAFIAGDSGTPDGAPPRRLFLARADASSVIEPDLGGRQPFPFGPELAWSPDQQWIAVHLVDPGDPDIAIDAPVYAVRTDGSATRALGAGGEVSWAADSAAIAIWTERDGHYEVAVAALDGSAPVRTPVEVAVRGGLSIYTRPFIWSVAAHRVFYGQRGCGQGGCTNGRLRMLDLMAGGDPQDLTDDGAIFVAFLDDSR